MEGMCITITQVDSISVKESHDSSQIMVQLDSN